MVGLAGWLALAAFVIAAPASGGDSPLKGGDLAKRLSGPEMKSEDAVGKVVFFEYWGYN